MENTYINNNNNNNRNKEDENKHKIQKPEEEQQEHFMKEIKITKYINKNKEKILKQFIRMTTKELQQE